MKSGSTNVDDGDDDSDEEVNKLVIKTVQRKIPRPEVETFISCLLVIYCKFMHTE